MAFKLFASLALLAVVSAQYQHHYEPAKAYSSEHAVNAVEHETPAEYEFSYAVHDEQTGDIKSQQESRKGDAVHGRYELIDADGYKRIVEYTADEHTGFNAVVHREPTNTKIPARNQYKQSAHAPAAQTEYYQPEPIAQYKSEPIVAKLSAPVPKKVQHNNEPAHVRFNGPHNNYNY